MDPEERRNRLRRVALRTTTAASPLRSRALASVRSAHSDRSDEEQLYFNAPYSTESDSGFDDGDLVRSHRMHMSRGGAAQPLSADKRRQRVQKVSGIRSAAGGATFRGDLPPMAISDYSETDDETLSSLHRPVQRPSMFAQLLGGSDVEDKLADWRTFAGEKKKKKRNKTGKPRGSTEGQRKAKTSVLAQRRARARKARERDTDSSEEEREVRKPGLPYPGFMNQMVEPPTVKDRYLSIQKGIRSLFRHESLARRMVPSIEDTVRGFLASSEERVRRREPAPDHLEIILDNSFKRMVAHGVCHFYSLESQSRDTPLGCVPESQREAALQQQQRRHRSRKGALHMPAGAGRTVRVTRISIPPVLRAPEYLNQWSILHVPLLGNVLRDRKQRFFLRRGRAREHQQAGGLGVQGADVDHPLAMNFPALVSESEWDTESEWETDREGPVAGPSRADPLSAR